MNIQRISAIYFSATGNTRKIVQVFAQSLAQALDCSWEVRDFTLPQNRETPIYLASTDLAVVALPTYAGKLPNKILPFVQTGILGSVTPAVALVTYGNRSFDNSLAELCHALQSNDFQILGAAALPCRHAFTNKLADQRPSGEDLESLMDFARQVAAKAAQATVPLPTVPVPGDSAAPYYVPKGLDGQPAQFLKARPKTHLDRCTRCGACARSCPMGAISREDPTQVTGTCIKCQRCVRSCPQSAKYFDDPAFLSHVAMLEANFQDEKEIQYYL